MFSNLSKCLFGLQLIAAVLLVAILLWLPSFSITFGAITFGVIFIALALLQLFFNKKPEKLSKQTYEDQLEDNLNINRSYLDLTNALDEAAIVAFTDAKGVITKVNKRFCTISKYDEAELLGNDHRILNSGFHDSTFFKNLWATIGSGNIWRGEVKNKAKDGSYYWVDTTVIPFLNEAGKPIKYAAIRFDITKQKEVEESLSAELLRNIDLNKQFSDIKNALDSTAIVAITDNKGTILKVNKTFCELSKYTEQELLGQDHRILNSGYHGSAFFKELWATIGSGKIWTGEVKNKAKDGSLYWVDTKIVPFLNDAGKPERYIAIRFDITNRKRMEEALQDAFIDLQEYTKVISHDLKTPLRSISTLVDFLKEDYGDLQLDVVRQLDQIKSKSIDMNDIINGLLEFNKVSVQEESLVFEMDNLVANILEKIPVGIEVSKEHKFPAIKSMQQKVEEVLLQLTHNAIKFNPKKNKKVTFSYKDESRYHIISIEDNGTGIDAQHHERIFDLFQVLSESNSGKGIGLSICKKMVQQLGGEIWIDSTLNQGTKVSFSIPK